MALASLVRILHAPCNVCYNDCKNTIRYRSKVWSYQAGVISLVVSLCLCSEAERTREQTRRGRERERERKRERDRGSMCHACNNDMGRAPCIAGPVQNAAQFRGNW